MNVAVGVFGGRSKWAGLVALAAVVALTASCAPPRAPLPPGVLVVSKEQASSWTRSFNPLSPLAGPRWPTLAGVYEPLVVWNSVRGEFVPWLSTSWRFTNEQRTLELTLRDGVLWSDGQRFAANDVVFTFQLLKKFKALDRRSVWAFLDDVRAVDDHTVAFDFNRVFFPGFSDIVAQAIVPEHIWRDVKDPVTFANEEPVATGPFTEVRVFASQVYELGKNPRYWQPGRPGIDALRFPAFAGNDGANLALAFDEVDWAANFIPAIDRVYVERDPAHHHYWFPLTGATIFLYPNTARAPFDDVRVRKAISHAIDRALVVDVGLFGYSRPADATGLSDGLAQWRDPAVSKDAGPVAFDVAAANALLDDAGFGRGKDGLRRDAKGKVLTWSIITVAGWSDWIRSAQVIARGLRDVGVDASVRTNDYGAWYDHLQNGDYDLSIGWSLEGPTPWVFYRWLLSPETKLPIGTAAPGNWHRYGSEKGGALLRAFETESDETRQKAIIADVERIFADELPAIPLFYSPSWAAYSTARITGFPSKEDPYADPSPNHDERGETLLVLTRLNRAGVVDDKKAAPAKNGAQP